MPIGLESTTEGLAVISVMQIGRWSDLSIKKAPSRFEEAWLIMMFQITVFSSGHPSFLQIWEPFVLLINERSGSLYLF